MTKEVRKTALITGITGQDGSYLAELLLNKGYEVHGIKRRSSSFNTSRIDELYQDPHEKDQKFFLHYGDLIDSTNILKIIEKVQPDEMGRRADTKEFVIKIDKRYFRPTEVDELLGDSTKAKEKLNWKPQISLTQLVSEIIEEDLKEAKKDAI